MNGSEHFALVPALLRHRHTRGLLESCAVITVSEHVSGDQYRPEIHVAVVVKLVLAVEQLNWDVITVLGQD